MKYLFEENLNNLVKESKRVFLFLDYDGTLTDFVDSPAFAFLDKHTKSLLRKISKNKNFITGIISGRALEDVRRRVGLRGVLYAGNHGLELYVKGKEVSSSKKISKKYAKALGEIKEKLKERLKDVEGVIFEDKDIILAVHFRLATKKNINKLKNIFKRVITPYLKKKIIKIGIGKSLLEIRPNVKFSKFDALKFFEDKFKKKKTETTIYIGDDLTDEDIFSKMNKKDLSIRVGQDKGSKARYFLKDLYDVERFLSLLIEIRP